ncbi:MAG: hypothetical protein Q4C42_11610 [Clostridia bacterium]|nr:hypothetical protein [Clostridia bacterium]
MSEKEIVMANKVKAITDKGGQAEVKLDRNGDYVIYEVNKKKL